MNWQLGIASWALGGGVLGAIGGAINAANCDLVSIPGPRATSTVETSIGSFTHSIPTSYETKYDCPLGGRVDDPETAIAYGSIGAGLLGLLAGSVNKQRS